MKPQRFEGIVGLDGPERYEHFVKSVVDRGEAWGLFGDGWALATEAAGADAFALWPEEEFAAVCAVAQWADCVPTSIPLDELIDERLPRLEDDGVGVAVFPTGQDKGVFPPIERLRRDLEAEKENYL